MPQQAPHDELIARVKKYAWRLTALYVWIKGIAAVVGLYSSFNRLESILIEGLTTLLSSVGLAPASTVLLSFVLKTGWILLITGFKFFELIGLLFYILTMPVWLPMVLIWRLSSKTEPAVETASSKGLIDNKTQRTRVLAISGWLLIAWFLLFGNAFTHRQIIPGLLMAGIIFLLLTYRLFLRVRPGTEVNLSPFRWLLKVNFIVADSQLARLDKQYKDIRAIQSDKTLVRTTKRLFLRTAALLRGRIANERISLFVLGEFIFSLVIVGASAVLFWALIIKAINPVGLSLLTCLHLSASHFLPGLQAPTPENALPTWSRVGASATAFILFVIYIGPASSVLPELQRATVKGLKHVYRGIRKTSLVLAAEERSLKIREGRLQKQQADERQVDSVA